MSGDAQATFAATLVDEWVRCGVRHAVVSPGSRSTPLALALAADERVELSVHLDERSAAFVALGVGLATGLPAVLLCTSGTAAANLHPAVVEAHQGRVPLLVCTADRPPELQGFGAPQTIDQTHLYGRAVRWFAEPGPPDAGSAGTWRSLAARAVLEATGPPPGPVQLNLGFRDPLVALPGPLPPGRSGDRPWHERRAPGPPPADVVASVAGLVAGRRGVVVAGGGAGGDPSAVGALAGTLGWPVLADPRSGCRVPDATTVAAGDALLRDGAFASRHRPEVVLRLGSPPASKVVGEWLRDSGARHVVIDRDGAWVDPDRTSELLVACDPAAFALALRQALPAEGAVGGGAWLRSWASAEAAAQRAMGTVLVGTLPRDPAVARAVAAALPDGATLVVSSSMPVRDLEWYAAPRRGLRVLANRGANGIDGVLSTAVGVATAARGSGAATVVLLGDLAFLHDTNGLLGVAARGIDLTVVVVDNRGGAIFSFLPQQAALSPARFEQLFGTPHDVALADLAAAHGVTTVRVHDLALVRPVVSGVAGAGGTHVVVVETDRAANVAAHDEVHAAVAAALAALEDPGAA